MSNTSLSVLLALVALLAAAALATSILALRGRGSSGRSGASAPLPTDLAGLRTEVERLRSQGGRALQNLSVVRYDAFGDMGGRLSWSLALVDQAGNGVVLTSIHGRSEARTYAKSVSAWSGDQQLSPEEAEALASVKSQ